MKKTAAILVSWLVGLQAADSAMTMWATNHGYTEVNPIVAPIADTWWLPPSKVLPALLVGMVVVGVMGRIPMVPKAINFGLAVASVFLAVVVASNVAELV